MKSTKYINVISGKGGTGKTLLCTILADLLGNQDIQVLIIDMDMFVRGLTALLYFHKGENLNIANENELTVSDIFYNTKKFSDIENKRLAIHRYRSFDICPAVSRINQVFDNERNSLFDLKRNEKNFNDLLKLIPRDTYDYIIFDCRSGYDSLISTVHEKSNFTICVQEEDDISDVTANNLIKQLERDSYDKPVFKIINKARNIKSINEIGNKKTTGHGMSLLGYIPFDMDVMNSFGEKSFWDDISKSLYKEALAETWNTLSAKEGLKHTLTYKRFSPFIISQLEKPFSMLMTTNRVFAFMGLILAILGLMYNFIDSEVRYYFQKNPDKLISTVISALGIIIFLSSFLIKRKK